MSNNYLKKELYNRIRNDTSLFEFIQSGSLDGIWYWDLVNPDHEWMSPKFWETLGYNPDEKKHRSSEWQDIIFKEDLKVANENFVKHCEDPKHPYDQIVRYRHKNGSTVWIRCRGLAIRNSAGEAVRMLGAHTDITGLKENEREISRITNEYEKVFNGTQDAMFLIRVTDHSRYRFVRNNTAHQRKTGISLSRFMDRSPEELLGPEMGSVVTRNYQRCVNARESITYEEELSLPAGTRLWLTTLTPITENGVVTHLVGSSTDITERKAMELELQKYANYDKLTGLPNRRLFFERLEQAILENRRDNRRFALMFIDLDGFKTINDSFGHEAGDLVLEVVGTRLRKCVRESDTVARMGGDEFTVIVRNIEDEHSVRSIAEKIQKSIRQPVPAEPGEYHVRSSIGISLYPEDGRDGETILKHADAAMYRVKNSGKGGIVFFKELS